MNLILVVKIQNCTARKFYFLAVVEKCCLPMSSEEMLHNCQPKNVFVFLKHCHQPLRCPLLNRLSVPKYFFSQSQRGTVPRENLSGKKLSEVKDCRNKSDGLSPDDFINCLEKPSRLYSDRQRPAGLRSGGLILHHRPRLQR